MLLFAVYGALILHTYCVKAIPTVRFLQLDGFEDNSTIERPFTPTDFSGSYTRFMELSRTGHLCPKTLEILSNGEVKSDGSIEIRHSDTKLNDDKCSSDGSLSFHFGRKLAKDFIENQLLLSMEASGIEAVMRDILMSLRDFYYTVETTRIDCGGASLFSGTVILFTSDSAIFGNALQIPWSGHPRIAFLRDGQKSCAFNGTWIPQQEDVEVEESTAPGLVQSSPEQTNPENTPTNPPNAELFPSPIPTENDESDGTKISTTTVPPTTSIAFSSTSSMETGTTSLPTSTTKMGPSTVTSNPSTFPTRTLPVFTSSSTEISTMTSSPRTSPATASPSTESSTMAPMTSQKSTTAAVADTSTRDILSFTSSLVATTASNMFPSSATNSFVTTVAATMTEKGLTPPVNTMQTSAGTGTVTTVAATMTEKGLTPPVNTMQTSTGTGTPVTTNSIASSTTIASTSLTGPTVTFTDTSAPTSTVQPATTSDSTSSKNPDFATAPSSSTATTSPSTIDSNTSATVPRSFSPTTSTSTSTTNIPMASSSVGPSEQNSADGSSHGNVDMFSSPHPSTSLSIEDERGTNGTFSHGMPVFTEEPSYGYSENTESPGGSDEEMPSPSTSPNSTGITIMPSEVSPEPSFLTPTSPPITLPGQNSGASASSDDGSTCFPAHASVKLSSGKRIRMDQVHLGDTVHVGDGKTSSIIGFTHSDYRVTAKFIRFITDSGNVLEVTPTHFVYTSKGLVEAAHVSENDYLKLDGGESTKVRRKDSIFLTGLFNPQTLHGDIVVNGFVTSTYTTAIDPNTAHALLAPIRLLNIFGSRTSVVTMLSSNEWIVGMAAKVFSSYMT